MGDMSRLSDIIRRGEKLTPTMFVANPELLQQLQATIERLAKQKAYQQLVLLVNRLGGHSLEAMSAAIGEDQYDTENRLRNLCRGIAENDKLIGNATHPRMLER